jgi:hypothetical protein
MTNNDEILGLPIVVALRALTPVRQYFGRFNMARQEKWVFGHRHSGAYKHRFSWTKHRPTPDRQERSVTRRAPNPPNPASAEPAACR